MKDWSNAIPKAITKNEINTKKKKKKDKPKKPINELKQKTKIYSNNTKKGSEKKTKK